MPHIVRDRTRGFRLGIAVKTQLQCKSSSTRRLFVAAEIKHRGEAEKWRSRRIVRYRRYRFREKLINYQRRAASSCEEYVRGT